MVTEKDLEKYIQSSNLQQQDIQLLITEIDKLLGPLELKTEQTNDTFYIDADAMATEFTDNVNYLLSYYYRAATNVIVLAHEMTKHASYRDTGPLWEFLHHCRNAVSHNGLFNFRSGEPRQPAIWGRFQLVNSMHGTPLFKGDTGNGLLSPGDPIRLLWDIEQAYPAMVA